MRYALPCQRITRFLSHLLPRQANGSAVKRVLLDAAYRFKRCSTISKQANRWMRSSMIFRVSRESTPLQFLIKQAKLPRNC
jgi:hypothetical protein